mmetsp:Transcript_76487/g.216251  ORF Transcript_76487/g.216251 Transcript_76487/m.216251 type:complete len:412 (-) Transcript_76487:238-1473(-)
MMAYPDGEAIGPYKVLKFLGRGSFGVVLLAENPRQPKHQFALKLVLCDNLDAEAIAKARDAALAEAELLRRLRHPNVVSCHEVCWEPVRNVVWFALDYMDGGDIQSMIDARRRNGEPPPDTDFVRKVFLAVGGALRYIHMQGVLHRDVKPSNVLLTSAGKEIKLADFGISKIIEATGRAHTVVGTPPYMSPEIVCGEPYGPAADAWALGVCIYELAALRRPFEAGNQLALVRQIVEQHPAPLPLGTAPDVAREVEKLLEKDPSQRLLLAGPVSLRLDTPGALPPPPSFPPPATPPDNNAGDRELDVEVVTGDNWNALTEVDLCDAAQSSVRCQGVEVTKSPRAPASAFSESEDDKPSEKPSKSSGRKWFKFGMPSITGRGGHESTVNSHVTLVSAFTGEQGDDEDYMLRGR